MPVPPQRDPDRTLRYVAAMVATVTIGGVAVTEIVRAGALSPGLLGLLAGPVALIITAVFLTRNGGK